MRIAVISHGHPELSAGGAERAAYSLFRHLKSQKDIEPVFVARVERQQLGHDGWFGAFRGRKDECLWSPPPIDWFRCTSLHFDDLQRQVSTLAGFLKPDVVHFHHYFHFGLETFDLFKKIAKCGTVLTLHEYGMICNHHGQMVKTGSMRLCNSASPAECNACFPQFTSGQFFLREALIKDLAGSVDLFVSPSEFLIEKYVAWGLAKQRMTKIENLLPPEFETPLTEKAAPPKKRDARIRLAYFGQITPYKGATILVESLKHLPESILERIEVVIFGANLETQPASFREALAKQMEESSAQVSFFGPYRNEDVRSLMREVDWLIMPSIWWENSPLVIQEARSVGLPVLVSNIGGMAEKIEDGVTGLHFLAGSSLDLARRIESIVTGATTIRPAPLDVAAQNEVALEGHQSLYRDLGKRAGRTARSSR